MEETYIWKRPNYKKLLISLYTYLKLRGDICGRKSPPAVSTPMVPMSPSKTTQIL